MARRLRYHLPLRVFEVALGGNPVPLSSIREVVAARHVDDALREARRLLVATYDRAVRTVTMGEREIVAYVHPGKAPKQAPPTSEKRRRY